MTKLMCAVMAIGLAACASAHAEMLIDVNFTSAYNMATPVTASGAAAIGAAGDLWNGVPGDPGAGMGIALTDTTGAATGVSLAFQSQGSFNLAANGETSPSPNPALTSQYLFDIGVAAPGTIGLTLSGLVAGASYDLYVYSQGDPSSLSRSAEITANGVGPAAVSADGTAASFSAGVNYAPFLSLAADASGVIQINAVSTGTTGGGEVDINGLQLRAAAVPEPSSLMLCGVGLALGLASAHRRHRTT